MKAWEFTGADRPPRLLGRERLRTDAVGVL